jgi:hypothetical protein
MFIGMSAKVNLVFYLNSLNRRSVTLMRNNNTVMPGRNVNLHNQDGPTTYAPRQCKKLKFELHGYYLLGISIKRKYLLHYVA